jgi:predicted anti-sigma-YlaC factor YlaD
MKPFITVIALLSLTGCSVKRMAVNKLGDALASGGSTYETDDDPDLVGDALPFGLKTIESLLAQSPKHKGLLLAASSGFAEYGYAFVDIRADEAMDVSMDRGKYLRARARRLYLRAERYGMRGLEVSYPGISAALDSEPETAAARVRKPDVALLYWTAASLGLAISCSKSQPEMIAQIPAVDAMLRRVRELDEGFGAGALWEALISLESARAGVKPEVQQQRMREYYERALALSKGEHASTFVSYAENACIPAQDRAKFQATLQKALAIDADLKPDNRLANLVSQRRARWLLGRIDELFVEGAPTN